MTGRAIARLSIFFSQFCLLKKSNLIRLMYMYGNDDDDDDDEYLNFAIYQIKVSIFSSSLLEFCLSLCVSHINPEFAKKNSSIL